jgi:serine protease
MHLHQLIRPLAAALLAAGVAAAAAAPSTGPVDGFIIQWRAGSTAAGPAREATQSVAGMAATEAGLHERAARLLAERQLPLRADRLLAGRWQRLATAAPLSADQAQLLATQLRALPGVAAVVPDVREQRQGLTPNDVRYAAQWWLQPRSAVAGTAAGNTGAAGVSEAWSSTTGAPTSGAAAVVAVLDSGITSHPELNSHLLPGYDFVTNSTYANDGDGRDNDPADPGDAVTDAMRTAQPGAYGACPGASTSSWHGTTIAGQLAALSNNTEGVAGVNWQARFVPVRVAGQCGAAVSDIIDGLRWAGGLAVPGVPANPNPARLVVLSYGGVEPCDAASADSATAATAQLYQQVIAELRGAGTLVFVAAGNQRGAVGRPAGCPGAFGVTALNREGFKAIYANFGAGLALATPGGDAATGAKCDAELADSGLVSTGNLGDTSVGPAGYVAASGTSFAAPVVAGVASLMLTLNPALTVDQLEAGLKRSAAPFPTAASLGTCAADNPGRCACTTATCGAGLLDAAEAVRYAGNPTGYQPPTRSATALTGSRFDTCAVLMGRQPADTPPPSDGTGTGSGANGTGGGSADAWLLLLAGLGAVVARRAPGRPR